MSEKVVKIPRSYFHKDAPDDKREVLEYFRGLEDKLSFRVVPDDREVVIHILTPEELSNV